MKYQGYTEFYWNNYNPRYHEEFFSLLAEDLPEPYTLAMWWYAVGYDLHANKIWC